MTLSRWLGVVCCLCVCALPAQAQRTVQDFDNPGTPFTMTNFGGDPAQVLPNGPSGNFARLAYADVMGTLNVIAFDRTTEGAVTRVVAEFDYRIGGAANKADGMGFVLLNTAVHGTSGGGPAFSEEAVADQSLGFGFDTFNNGLPADPDDNHVSVTYNQPGFTTVAAFSLTPFGYNLHRDDLPNDASFDHATIVVDIAEGGGATVSLTITPAGGASFTPIDSYVIPGVTPYEMRAAFSARTGGATDNHDIDNISITFSQ